VPALGTATEALTKHPRLQLAYREYLFTLHEIMRASVRLMEEAVRQLATRPAEPLTEPLSRYLVKHIPEETGHHEWVIEDLRVLGVERSELHKRTPSPEVAALVGSQYYWIYHCHPVMLLGYVAVVERYPPTLRRVDELVARSGLPRRAFGALERHAYVDIRHKADFDDLIASLPLTPILMRYIKTSALAAINFAIAALEQAMRRADP
jgi:hypothetical protein